MNYNIENTNISYNDNLTSEQQANRLRLFASRNPLAQITVAELVQS